MDRLHRNTHKTHGHGTEGIEVGDNARPLLQLAPLNSIRFVLPSMPVSVNSLYDVWWNTREVKLKDVARRWKTKAKEHMPPWRLTPGTMVRIDMEFHFSMYCKNGNQRIKDAHNYQPLLINAVAERYGFNDCTVTEWSGRAVDSEHERVVVTVSEIQNGK